MNPCPFCHNDEDFDVAYYQESDEYWVICESCGASGPICQSHSEAIERWNGKSLFAVIKSALLRILGKQQYTYKGRYH